MAAVILAACFSSGVKLSSSIKVTTFWKDFRCCVVYPWLESEAILAGLVYAYRVIEHEWVEPLILAIIG